MTRKDELDAKLPELFKSFLRKAYPYSVKGRDEQYAASTVSKP